MLDGADGNAGLVRQAGAQLRIRDVVVARGDFGMFPADVAAPEDAAAVRGSRVKRHEDTPAGMKADAAALAAVVEGVLPDGGGVVRRASRRGLGSAARREE